MINKIMGAEMLRTSEILKKLKTMNVLIVTLNKGDKTFFVGP